MTFWVTLARPIRYRGADRQAFSVDGETPVEATANTYKALASVGVNTGAVEVVSAKPLPYPGEPRLGYKSGDCPSFCLHPDKCAGSGSCPRNYSCSE